MNKDGLRILGRAHTVDQSLKAIDMARQLFTHYSIDLIYGRPNLTTENWSTELEYVLSLGIPHLSLYELTVAPHTRLYNAVQRGSLCLPTDDCVADQMDVCIQMTTNNGRMHRYEVSNYAMPSHESVHNRNYWHSGDYLPLGPAAHERLSICGHRYSIENDSNVDSWMRKVMMKYPIMDSSSVRDCVINRSNESVEDDDAAAAAAAAAQSSSIVGIIASCGGRAHLLTQRGIACEVLLMGLRTPEGVSRELFQSLCGISLDDFLDINAVRRMVESAHLCVDDTKIRVTFPKGINVLNTILVDLW
jgi:coproporphyrinogen III oxidase-like Fe-S oxidoreductase